MNLEIHKKKKNLSDSVNLIPMINLVFLLLIFFMLTGVIKKKDKIEIIRPYSEFGVESDYKGNEFLITVLEDSSILVNGEKIHFEAFKDMINPKIKLIIDIHKNSKITDFNKLIKEVKEKNIKKIFIKVTDQQKEP